MMRSFSDTNTIYKMRNYIFTSLFFSSPPFSLLSTKLSCREHAQERHFGMDISNLRFLCDNSARTLPATSLMSTHTGHGTVAAGNERGNSIGNGNCNCNGNSCGNYIKTLVS